VEGVGGAGERGCREFGEPAVLRVARQFGGRPCESAVVVGVIDLYRSLSAVRSARQHSRACTPDKRNVPRWKFSPRGREQPRRARARGVTNRCRRGDDVAPPTSGGRSDDVASRRVVRPHYRRDVATTPAEQPETETAFRWRVDWRGRGGDGGETPYRPYPRWLANLAARL